MIDKEAIESVIDSIVELKEKSGVKKTVQSGIYKQLGIEKKQPEDKLPEFYPGYTLAAKWLNQIRVHAEKGNFPEWLFENNSPNQTPKELEYCKANYRQNTIEVFKDYVDTMGRAYHYGNYSIEWPAEDDQYVKQNLTLKEYLTKTLPTYASLETFVFEFLAPLKLMDAMSVVAVLPGVVETIEDENGNRVIDPEKMLEPYPEYFHTTKVLHLDENYAVIESPEKSEVIFNTKTVKEGLVFWIIDEKWYYQARQIGKQIDYEFEIIEVFEHNLGYIPVIRSGGLTILIDDIVMEQSPFLYVVDTLDEILIDAALLRTSKSNCCYPYRVMLGDPCEATMKVDGETLTCDEGYFRYHDGNVLECNACKGSGQKARISPTGVMLIKPKTVTTDGDGINPSDALFYAAPSTETLTKLRQEIDYNFVKAYNTLHLKKDNSNVQGGNEVTATEIVNENKALIASITTNCQQLFEIYTFLVKTIGTIRYGDNFKMPIIKEPVSFDFFTVDEYLKKISDSITSGQPAIITQSVIRDAANRIFFKDNESRMIFELVSKTDRLMSMTEQDINTKQAKKLVDNWEVVLHDSAMMFIDELVEEDPGFFELPLSEQKAKLIEKAKTFAATIGPQTGVIQNAQTRLAAILNTA